jgi:hypothetical protein
LARTFKGKTRFPYRILIVPKDQPAKPKPYVGTQQWKYRALYNIKMMLSIQIHKASRRAKWKWYQFYAVRGYGAPGGLEFVCPVSGMIATPIRQEQAVSPRKYWASCAAKSKLILKWLDSFPPQRYTKELNHYLLRLIVITYGQREIDEYTELNPFTKPKLWQEQFSTTSDTPRQDGHGLPLHKLSTELPCAEKLYALTDL